MTESLRLPTELERLGGITDDVSLADALYAILEKERAKDADEADGGSAKRGVMGHHLVFLLRDFLFHTQYLANKFALCLKILPILC